jgi:hypothetical protein
MMITFNTVEDYIEVIAGDLDPVTKKPTSNWLSSPIISLARYDTDVVGKMSTQTINNVGYTEKQAKLAQKIVLTYKRQLAQKNIDVTPVENPVYRLPIRAMDYSMRLYLEDDSIMVKFPYHQKFIESIRDFSKESQGKSKWNPDKKVWQVDLTEYNINWLNTFAEVNKFDVDPTITEIVNKITEVENSNYRICLTISDGAIVIENAPDSLLSYIQEHIGDLTPDNLIKLVDVSNTLGYTVDRDILDAISSEYGHRFVNLLTNRELKIDPSAMFTDDNFGTILEYAKVTNRYPVYVYEPDLSGRMLKQIEERFTSDEYVASLTVNKPTVTETTKVVYITKPVKDQLPLLISSAGMIYGGEKELMVQRSQKIVYCAAEVYNKKKNSDGVKGFAS